MTDALPPDHTPSGASTGAGNAAASSEVRVMFDRIAHGLAASPVSSTTAAEVSSQLVSIPRISKGPVQMRASTIRCTERGRCLAR